MTQKSMTLSAGEYRVLAASNLNDAVQFVNNNNQISAEHVQALGDHLDRILVFIKSWHAAAPAQSATPPAEAPAGPEAGAAPVQANGAAEPKKRRGGWPAGKPRKPQAAQVQ